MGQESDITKTHELTRQMFFHIYSKYTII